MRPGALVIPRAPLASHVHCEAGGRERNELRHNYGSVMPVGASKPWWSSNDRADRAHAAIRRQFAAGSPTK
jgi:hypothetical protein